MANENGFASVCAEKFRLHKRQESLLPLPTWEKGMVNIWDPQCCYRAVGCIPILIFFY